MTARERHVMEHACAWQHKNRLYRNRFVCGPDSDDWATLHGLCARGLMYVRCGPDDIMGGGMTIFSVTQAGLDALASDAEAMTKEPKLLRVAIWLCSACLAGEGEECHTPGCAMWLMSPPSRAIDENFYEVIPEDVRGDAPVTKEGERG